MSFDREFAEALVAQMSASGWRAILPSGVLPNPLEITFEDTQTLHMGIYARRLTPQSSTTSDHHRPEGEMHAQMIFDGDQRGAGARNHLRFSDGVKTVLFGYYVIDGNYVVAAYDPAVHREYAYSKSLQVKAWHLQHGFNNGIAFQLRQNGETIVIFRLDEIAEYFLEAEHLHHLSPSIVHEAQRDEQEDMGIQQALIVAEDEEPERMPELNVTERRQRLVKAAQYIRSSNFRMGIIAAYGRCATCGFQYDYILDAAHIVPVAEGGTDTYDNGLALCPTCHRMYDKGYILVDGTYRVFINPDYAEQYDQLGLADSLQDLQARLRDQLYLPEDEQYHPAPENLQRTFDARR